MISRGAHTASLLHSMQCNKPVVLGSNSLHCAGIGVAAGGFGNAMLR